MKRVRHSILALRIFSVVAELGSASRAAESMGLTQSAVTKHIQSLEEYVGTDLFDRRQQGMKLNPAGRRYLKAVLGALQMLDDAAANLRSPSLHTTRIAGEVRLGVAPAFAQRWLLSRLSEFQRTHPDIVIKLVPRTSAASWRDAAPDAHIQTGGGRFPGFRATYLIGSQLRIVISKARMKEIALLSGSSARDPEATLASLLRSVPLLTHMLVPKLWDEALKQLHSDQLPALERVYFEQYSVLIPAAVGGIGLGLIPEFLLTDEIRAGKLLCVGEPLHSRIGFYFLTPTGRRRSSAIEVFSSWLQAQCQRPEGSGGR